MRARRAAASWSSCATARYAAEQVVVATGPFQMPRVPPIAERPRRRRSSSCTAPTTAGRRDVPDGPVLVVGAATPATRSPRSSSASHEVHLAVGARQAPLPQRILGRDLFRYLEATGADGQDRRLAAGAAAQGPRDADRLQPARARRKQGIRLRARSTGAPDARSGSPTAAQLAVSAVIWATGFRARPLLRAAPVFDDDGRVEHRRGVTAVPGLYFLGLPWQHTRGSALLGWVKDDAQYIASEIARASTRSSEPSPSARPRSSGRREEPRRKAGLRSGPCPVRARRRSPPVCGGRGWCTRRGGAAWRRACRAASRRARGPSGRRS